jgi:hypothetical protein
VSAARPRRAAHRVRKPPRLALDDPAAQAWFARMMQIALERRRRRLAAAPDGGDRDGA